MSETTGHGPAPHATGEPFDHELRYKPIVTFVVGIAALMAFAMVTMILFSKYLQKRETAKDPKPSPMKEANVPRPRPRIALQSDPTADMNAWRAEETKLLSSYAWTDATKEVARIPVERAIELTLQKGVAPEPAPATASAPAAPPAPGPK